MNLLGEFRGALVLQWVGKNDGAPTSRDVDARAERKYVDHNQDIDSSGESRDAAGAPFAADVITVLI